MAESLLVAPALTLWHREVVRFLRQRTRVVGALGTPVIFWLVLGSGVGDSLRGAGAMAKTGYLEYIFPGMAVLIVLFTAIFSTISLIEDRREGFLQSVLVAPSYRSAIALGKIFGSATLAVGQAAVFFLLAPLLGIQFTVMSVAAIAGTLVLLSVMLSALGFLIAWPMTSTQGFHAIMNLFLVPMWLLSGSFFPVEGAAAWLRWVMIVNPLTYGLSLMRHAMYTATGQDAGVSTTPAVCLAVTLACTVVLMILSIVIVKKGSHAAS